MECFSFLDVWYTWDINFWIMKFSFLSQRGFTLVELLVVLSIMSFFASVVITSVTGARSRGVDSSIRQTMNNMRTQAQLYYENQTPFSYANVCLNDTQIAKSISEVNRLSQATVVGLCSDSLAGNGSTWAFASSLKGGGFWCVDGTGVARSKDQSGSSYDGLITGTGIAHPAITNTSVTVTPKYNTNCN
jgi:prepilin-type N-terminal cleavage/methylation domain-containing protein